MILAIMFDSKFNFNKVHFCKSKFHIVVNSTCASREQNEISNLFHFLIPKKKINLMKSKQNCLESIY